MELDYSKFDWAAFKQALAEMPTELLKVHFSELEGNANVAREIFEEANKQMHKALTTKVTAEMMSDKAYAELYKRNDK